MHRDLVGFVAQYFMVHCLMRYRLAALNVLSQKAAERPCCQSLYHLNMCHHSQSNCEPKQVIETTSEWLLKQT